MEETIHDEMHALYEELYRLFFGDKAVQKVSKKNLPYEMVYEIAKASKRLAKRLNENKT